MGVALGMLPLSVPPTVEAVSLPSVLPPPAVHVGAGLPAQLYYIAALDQLHSLLQYGIRSRNEVRALGLPHCDISNPDVQRYRRNTVVAPLARNLHDCVPLYLNPRNPMLYSLRNQAQRLVVLGVDYAVLAKPHCYADGNAAARDTRFSASAAVLADSLAALNAEQWTSVADGKRRRCAEVLLAAAVQPHHIRQVICADSSVAIRIARQYAGRFSVSGLPDFFWRE